MRDTVARLCAESSDRIPKWVLPVIRENLAAGRDVRLGERRRGELGPLRRGRGRAGRADRGRRPAGRHLTERARQQRADPLAFVRDRELFGDLIDHEPFVTAYLDTLSSLYERGSRATLERLMAAVS